VAGRYGIETDIQAAASGEPVVFHDESLDRLTISSGPVSRMTPAELGQIQMRGTQDRILALGDFLDLIGGRVPLFLEIKSHGRTDRTVERRVAEHLASYRGPIFVMSFDPASVAAMRRFAPQTPRGLSAMRFGKTSDKALSASARFRMTHMLDIYGLRPDFMTYEVNDLAVMAHSLRRRFPSLPIITWTVRTAEERRKAGQFADGMIFEGFRPPHMSV
jgi:glycerophosphoryl diester phosphodiesterase